MGGRVRSVELRVATLQFLELAEELVVLRVGDLRVGEDVVAVPVALDLDAELLDPSAGPFVDRGQAQLATFGWSVACAPT